MSIPVSAGEIIGFLGTRSTTDVNSYGTFSQQININGVNVNVTRLGMQFPLSTTAPQDLWSETTSSKSRVFFTYDSKACESNLVPTVVNVDQQPTAPSAISGTTTITCGSQTVLTATGGTNGSGAIYQWYAGGCGSGSVIGTGSSITVTPTNNTTYYVRRVGIKLYKYNSLCFTISNSKSDFNLPSLIKQSARSISYLWLPVHYLVEATIGSPMQQEQI